MKDGVHKYRHGRLPHWRFRGGIYFVTFNTVGRTLDEESREIALNALLFWHPQRYELSAITVMPNHVHLLCYLGEKEDRDELSRIIGSAKQYSALRINRRLGREGSLWKREFFDHLIRNEKELINTRDYIGRNPCRAGLVKEPDEYPFTWFDET